MGQSRTYRTKAIVLDKTKLKETDLILTLLDSSGKQIRAVAKGARKPGGRLAARCELGCEVDLLLARGRNLDVVSQAQLLSSPLGPQPSYELLSASSALLEVARYCSYENAEDDYIYPLTQAALGCLASSDDSHFDLLIAAYVFKLLTHLGYQPDIKSCVSCGDEHPTWFSASMGGALCASCSTGVPGAEELNQTLLDWIQALMFMPFLEISSVQIDAITAHHLLLLAHTWSVTHLDCRLRSFEFMLGR